MVEFALILTSPEGEKSIPVGEGASPDPFVIGRSAESDLFLNDPGVSRSHCRLVRRDDALFIEDLDSRAGTWRNGVRVEKPVPLADGDELRVGSILLRVRVEGRRARPAASRKKKAPEENATVPPATPPEARKKPKRPLRPDATIVAGSGTEGTAHALRRSFDLGDGETVIGRDPACPISLDSPLISRRHAEVRRVDAGLAVRDLRSTNGTFVNGQPVKGEATLAVGDVLGVGPYRLTFDGLHLRAETVKAGMAIEARGIGKEVNDRETGKPIHLLKDISLTIRPKEFVGFFGPSGCGKSTLMDTLNGRRPATEGAVLYNGENLYNHFDIYKRGIGYVPQELIFHEQLPVGDVLRYASRLRLPDDTTDAEIEANIDRVLGIVGLGSQKGTLVENLSGGQKKRVSIGIELLSKPTVLFLDEATSGLDLGTEALMMRLFRTLAEGGVTTLCITHYVDSLDTCDMVGCLMKGRLAFYGPPDELKKWFGVEAIREVYLLAEQHTPEEWEAGFRESEAYRKYVVERASPPGAGEKTVVRPGQAMEQVRPADPVRQLSVLTRRYVDVLKSDRRNLLLMLLVAPVIGLLASLVLSGAKDDVYSLARQQGQLSFTMTLTMFFLGLFAGIREIVKELPIYRHERFVSLEILPYLGSKVIPLSIIAGIQTALLLLTVHATSDMRADFVGQFVILFATAVGALLLGLAISAAVDTADKAVLLMILVLIPQFLFSNAFIQLEGVGEAIGMVAILSYWCHDGLKSLLPDHLLRLRAGGGGKLALFGNIGWFPDLVMILLFAAVYGGLALWFLRKKDGPYGRPFQMPFVRGGVWVQVRTRMARLGLLALDGSSRWIREIQKWWEARNRGR